MSSGERVRPVVDIDTDEFASLRGAERDAVLLGVHKLIRQLTAVQASLIHTVASSRSFTDDAHHSARAWVESVLNTSSSTASRLVRSAALLDDVPALANAVRVGSVGLDQIDELAKLQSNVLCRDELRAHGYRLVGPAKNLIWGDFRKVLARWKAYVDPDGSHRDHEQSRERRHVRFGTDGHDGVIHAEADAASIEELIDIVKAHIESELLKDCEERRLRYGADAENHPLRRTHQQRAFDAYQQIFRKAAATPVEGVVAPTVNIFTTEADLAAAIREFFGQPAGLVKSGRQRLCETEQGAPVDPADMVIAALLGKIRRVVVTNDGRYVSAGSRQRLFTGKLREMILLLGAHRCNRPGCSIRGPNVQIDHIESWICNGCTTAVNGGPMCPLHNRDKHRLGFTVTHDQHGWHHYRPDGTEIAPRGS